VALLDEKVSQHQTTVPDDGSTFIVQDVMLCHLQAPTSTKLYLPPTLSCYAFFAHVQFHIGVLT
jgi:hypothetical protein